MNIPATAANLKALKGMIPGLDIKPKRKAAPDVRTSAKRKWSITLTLDARVVSEANRTNEHWTTRRRRKQIQSESLLHPFSRPLLHALPWMLPMVVTWIRVHKPGSAEMDSDNLTIAFKGLRDSLALEIGVDDADPQVKWSYSQRTGSPCVELRIESAA